MPDASATCSPVRRFRSLAPNRWCAAKGSHHEQDHEVNLDGNYTALSTGADYQSGERVDVVNLSTLKYDGNGNWYGIPMTRSRNGEITDWADYYDGLTARRSALAARFTEWIEY